MMNKPWWFWIQHCKVELSRTRWPALLEMSQSCCRKQKPTNRYVVFVVQTEKQINRVCRFCASFSYCDCHLFMSRDNWSSWWQSVAEIVCSNLNQNLLDLWVVTNVKLSDLILNLYFYADSVEHPVYVTWKLTRVRLTIAEPAPAPLPLPLPAPKSIRTSCVA